MSANHRSVGTQWARCQNCRSVTEGQNAMQGLSLSQNDDSVTKDDTKGKEEARVSRHAKKNDNDEVELWGAAEELGNNVHCHGNKRQAEFHTKTIECIAEESATKT